MIVGTVAADGLPDATRGWGLEVTGPCEVRVLLSSSAATSLENLATTGAFALTVTHFTTFVSYQLKGHALRVEPATAEDRIRFDTFCAGCVRAIHEGDGTPEELIWRLPATGDRRLHRDRRQRVRPDARARGRCQARADGDERMSDSRDSRIALTDIASCFEGVVPAEIATASADGTPNITHLSRVHMIDDDHVALSNQFFSKTVRNLAENPRACVIVVDPHTYDSFKLILQYERTERRGPLFELMRRDIDAIAALTGMQDVFRLRSADVYRVVAIDQVLAARHVHDGEPAR